MAPASDAQVIAEINTFLSHQFNMSTGRTDGRIEAGFFDGQKSISTLTKWEAELEELKRSTPLAMDTDDLEQIIAPLEKRTGRSFRDDPALLRKLSQAYIKYKRVVLETQIAQLRGDEDIATIIAVRRRKSPDLGSLVTLFIKHRTADWSHRTRTKFDNVSNVMMDIIGHRTKLSEINRNTARELSEILHSLPPNYSKRKLFEGLSAKSAAALGQELELPGMGRKTIQDYFNHISAVFQFAVREELMERNPMIGLSVYAAKAGRDVVPYTSEDIGTIFNAPIFTGSMDDERNWKVPGSNVVRRGRYWVPIIAIHTGMRLNEICSLKATDIRAENGISYFDISTSHGRRLKTKQSVRKVPVHRDLVAVGFVDWVAQLGLDPADDLFPELRKDTSGTKSNGFSKWYHRFRKSVGITESGKNFHSFRHTFEDLLREASIPDEHNERIMGWSSPRMQRHYGAGPSIEALNKSMQRVDLRNFELSHLRG